MAALKSAFRAWLNGLLLLLTLAPLSGAATGTPTDLQVKAVFVYNFTHFVEWPRDAYATPTAPLVLGVLGNESFAAQLEEVVRGERKDEHPLVVRRLRSSDELGDCQILFIDSSEAARLGQILAAVSAGRTLTISDLDGAARRGVMIQFATANNRVRLLINVDSARAAGLTVSSKLLRPAEIVRSGN